MFRLAYNERKAVYEIHREGCRHLKAPHLDLMVGTYTQDNAKAVRDHVESHNDDVHALIGPCAR